MGGEQMRIALADTHVAQDEGNELFKVAVDKQDEVEKRVAKQAPCVVSICALSSAISAPC